MERDQEVELAEKHSEDMISQKESGEMSWGWIIMNMSRHIGYNVDKTQGSGLASIIKGQASDGSSAGGKPLE